MRSLFFTEELELVIHAPDSFRWKDDQYASLYRDYVCGIQGKLPTLEAVALEPILSLVGSLGLVIPFLERFDCRTRGKRMAKLAGAIREWY